MKKLSKKEQAQFVVDKFFEYYFKRFVGKSLNELSDEERVKYIEENKKVGIHGKLQSEKSMFKNYLTQVTGIKMIGPAFEGLWRLYGPKIIEDEK